MFTLDIIDTRIFHKKFSNSLLKLPKVTVTAKSENVVTKFARPFDMTIWFSTFIPDPDHFGHKFQLANWAQKLDFLFPIPEKYHETLLDFQLDNFSNQYFQSRQTKIKK